MSRVIVVVAVVLGEVGLVRIRRAEEGKEWKGGGKVSRQVGEG